MKTSYATLTKASLIDRLQAAEIQIAAMQDAAVPEYDAAGEAQPIEEPQLEGGKLFFDAFHASPAAQVITSLDDGVILDVNDAYCRLVGYTLDELIGRTTTQLGLWDSSTDIDRMIEQAKQDGFVHGEETNFRSRSGEIRTMILSINLSRMREIPCLIHSVVDITGHIQAQARLQAAQARLQHLLAFSPAVIFSSRASGDFGTTFVSDNIFALTGFEPHEFIEDPHFWISHVHPDDLPHINFQVTIVLEPGLHRKEYRFQIKDGSYRWFQNDMRLIRDENGTPVELVGSFTDIHDLKTAQQELLDLNRTLEERVQERTAELEDLYDNAPCGYHSLDAQGNYIRINQTELNWLGRTRAEVLGHSMAEFLTEKYAQEFRESLPSIAGNSWLKDREFDYVRKDGTVFPCLSTAAAISNASGIFVKSHSTVFDITERQKAEEQLRFQSNLLDVVGQAMIVTNQEGRIIYWNHAAETLYGWPAAEALGRSIVETIAQPSTNQAAEIMTALQQGQAWTGEFLVQRRDGTPFWAQVTDVPIRDDRGQQIGVIGASIDISKRIQAEQALRASEERLNFMLCKTPATIFTMKIGNNFPITFISDSVEYLLGYKANQFLDNPYFWRELIHPDALTAIEPMRQELFEKGHVDREFQVKCSDGRNLWRSIGITRLDESGPEPQEVIGYMIDIDDRKQAEAELAEQEEQNRLLFEESPDAIALVDAQGRFVRVNHAYELLAKTPQENLLGKTAGELRLIDVEAMGQMHTSLQQALRARDSYTTAVYVLHAGDGSIVHVESRIFLIKIGGVDNILVTSRDISLHKQAEETLSLANIEMERSLRLKDEFLANMSHELRTPLNGILGISESLLEHTTGDLTDKQLRYVRIIHESGLHLLNLINDILDLAKVEAGKITLNISNVNLEAICQSSLRMIKELAFKKNQTLSSTIEPSLGGIQADERRIKQMVVNLLSNAVKFTPSGGSLGLEVRGDQPNRQIVITIWDTGIGIQASDLPRLFQPFSQLNSGLTREHAGSGLGLVLVSEMARLHGGSVSVTSEPGQGSRFTISLPWIPAVNTQPVPSHSAEERTLTASPACILLVEDTEAVVVLVRDYLEAAGYRVEVAKDGGEVYAKARQHRPDLILMDVQLPVMDGLEVTRHLRLDAGFKHTRIIALTALAMPGDRERCLQAGMDDYLSKPVNLKDLALLVNSQLASQKG